MSAILAAIGGVFFGFGGMAVLVALATGAAISGMVRALRRDKRRLRTELEKREQAEKALQDNTGRKTAAEELNTQADQYRLLFEDNPSPMWVFDVESLRILAVNQAAIFNYGYSREEFLARSLRDIRPTEDVPSLVRAVSEETDSSNYGGEWRHLKKDGTVVTAAVYSSPTIFNHREARMTLAIDLTERRAVEGQLREAEEKYRSIFDNALEGIFQSTPDGLFISANPAFARMLGFANPEALVRERNDITRQSYAEPAKRQEFKRLLEKEGFVNDFELEVKRADGSRIWLSENVRLVRDAAGQILYYEGSAQDITARKQTEDRMRAILESALDCVITMDHQGRVVEFNPAAEKTFCYQRDEAIGQLLADLIIPPALREDHQRGLKDYLSTGDAPILGKRIELTGMRKDHSEFPLELAITRIGSQEPPMFTGFIRDITERKQGEDRLREQARLLDLAHDAIMVRDMEDRIEFWNQGAEALYGWTAEEACGRLSVDFLQYEEVEHGLVAQQILLETGVWSGERRHLTKEGELVVVRSRWTLVRDQQGQPKSKLVINTDITEQKKIEEQFLRAQRLDSIGTLASGVAHDLNNILLPIMLVAPVLRDETDPDERGKFLDIVESSAQRGADIIKQVLTFARGADGDRVLLQPIYLLEEVAKIARQTFPKSINVQTSYAENIRSLEAEPTQLQQVLLNLCINARDAMPNGGQLFVGAENFDVDEHCAGMTPGATVGPHVMLQVTDSGSGIPSDVVDKIFDPFFTTKDVGLGTGLGLSTVAGIVKGHGGFINLYSEPGQTSFKIFLPANEAVGTASVLPTETMIPRGDGQTILVVDDEASIRLVAELILKSHGYKVLVAEDGAEALALFAQQMGKVAAVVTDLAMPIMGGMMLVRALRRIEPGIKVMVSTGRNDESQTAEMAALKVNGCLLKPFTTRNLLLKLSDVLHPELQNAA